MKTDKELIRRLIFFIEFSAGCRGLAERSFALRGTEDPQEFFQKNVLELPIQKRGSLAAVIAWVLNAGFSWKTERPEIFGGYFVNHAGTCYYLTPER